MDSIIISDMFGSELKDGQIVFVRYVWNCYVGVVRNFRGLSLHEGAKRHWGFAPFHSIEQKNTYQIIGHTDPESDQFNPVVFDWFTSEEEGYDCPVKIQVYNNVSNQ